VRAGRADRTLWIFHTDRPAGDRLPGQNPRPGGVRPGPDAGIVDRDMTDRQATAHFAWRALAASVNQFEFPKESLTNFSFVTPAKAGIQGNQQPGYRPSPA